MRATIDATGRIVVPKSLRDALGLRPGQALEIHVSDKGLEIELGPTEMKLVKRGKGVVAVPAVPLPTLTAEDVRQTVDRIRR